MIAVPSYTPSFRHNGNDIPPPSNIEAEEAILGSILLDPYAIDIVSPRLRPEHFYITAHQNIYRACLKLSKSGKKTDLLQLTSFLADKKILTKIGGQSKLAGLVNRTVSAVNIDALATLVIDKHTRRVLLELGGDIREVAASSEFELEEIMSMLAEKTSKLITTPHGQSKEEALHNKYERVLEQVTELFTTIPNPSYRHFRLKTLADDYGYSTHFLEHLYLKSLVSQCSELLTYEELKELGGSEVREWLMNGLIPKASTILLAADGGIGKTKFVYSLAKILIEGSDFGDFVTTGEKRKILYYQGDESPGDMTQALETMGYSKSDINKYVRVRFGWSCENMPVLLQDLKEFQPDFVMIDSLSTANKFSMYRESDMEYARPLIEMAGLATKYKTTFLIVHHTNRAGDARGTTAIRNAVSEVWRITKDNTMFGTPNDRILEIDKSRSRSSGKRYRLMFSPEDLSFTFLGEDGIDNSGQSTRDAIKDFLASHRNVKYTSEEIAHYTNSSRYTAKRLLNEIAGDGLISAQRKPGCATLYSLSAEYLESPGSPPDSPPDIGSDVDTARPNNVVALITQSTPRSPLESTLESTYTVDAAEGDRVEPENETKPLNDENIFSNCEKGDHPITFAGNADSEEVSGWTALPEPQGDRPPQNHQSTPLVDNANLHNLTRETGTEKNSSCVKDDSGADDVRVLHEPEPHQSFSKNKTNRLKIKGITGQWKVKYAFGPKTIHITLTTPQEKEVSVDDFCSWNWRFELRDLKATVQSGIYDLEMRELLKDKTFDVQRPKYDEEEGFVSVTVPGCKLVGVPNPCGGPFAFEMPTGERFLVHGGLEDFNVSEVNHAGL